MRHCTRLGATFVILVLSASLAVAAPVVRGVVPGTAPHGARVLITGTGCDAPDVSVAFSDSSGSLVVAPIVVRSSRFIEVAVPPAAASGAVHVSNAAGPLGDLAFTVAADPTFSKALTIAALTPKGQDIFHQPSGAAIFVASGAIYFADTLNHLIRYVLPDGETLLTSGTGKPGYVDGPASQAQFSAPRGVAIDANNGIVYVADTGNNSIRAIALDGTVRTLAGSGRPEFADGLGTAASFSHPAGIAVDLAGNVYVADTGNNRIRRITPAGAVSTVAGGVTYGFLDGPAPQTLFTQPESVAVAASGTVFVADTQNNVLRKIENGVVTTIAGTGAPGDVDGAATTAQLKEPSALTLDEAGNLFFTDRLNNAVRELVAGSSPLVRTIIGSNPGYVDGDLGAAMFKDPSGIVFAGALAITDTMNDAVRMIYAAPHASAVWPARGPLAGNNVVRLLGTSFVPGATQVTVGSVPATEITFITSTEMLVTIPANASGNADVVVTTPGGTSTLAGGYTYLPPPTIASISPSKGKVAGGDIVTITGTAFGNDDDTIVTMANQPILMATVTSTSITGTTPPHDAANVDVMVTTPGGSATLANAFTYVPPPTITMVQPTRGKTAGGDTISITGTGFDSSVAVTIGGNVATNIVVTSTTSLAGTTPAGNTGTADVIVTSAGGSVTKTAAFTYVAPPVITSFTPTQGSTGSSVTIMGQNFDPLPSNNVVTIGGIHCSVTAASMSQLIVTIPATAASGRITVTTTGGTVTSASEFAIVDDHLSIQITAPAADSIVQSRSILVTGTAAGPHDMGIVVNGVPAQFDLSAAGTPEAPFQWFATIDPVPGPLTIVATATTPARATVAVQRSVTYMPADETLLLRAAPESGPVPLKVTFDFSQRVAATVTLYEFDLDDDGVFEVSSPTLPEYLATTLSTTGVHTATARVTLSDGRVLTTTAVVLAQSLAALDQVIRMTWSRFLGALSAADVNGAMAQLSSQTTAKYAPVLQAIGGALPTYAAALKQLYPIWIRGNFAHYLLVKKQPDGTYGFHVFFVRDDDGVWHILQF
jgi:sugar lactone lactonase YvrE